MLFANPREAGHPTHRKGQVTRLPPHTHILTNLGTCPSPGKVWSMPVWSDSIPPSKTSPASGSPQRNSSQFSSLISDHQMANVQWPLACTSCMHVSSSHMRVSHARVSLNACASRMRVSAHLSMLASRCASRHARLGMRVSAHGMHVHVHRHAHCGMHVCMCTCKSHAPGTSRQACMESSTRSNQHGQQCLRQCVC